jgi:hypothetical protein
MHGLQLSTYCRRTCCSERFAGSVNPAFTCAYSYKPAEQKALRNWWRGRDSRQRGRPDLPGRPR